MRVFISVGSNIERDKNIRGCLVELQKEYEPLMISPVYESAAYGFTGEDFYNLAVAFNIDPRADVSRVLDTLREIETRHGRRRGEHKFSSRTLDLDLLLFGDKVLKDRGLNVPRDEIHQYAFVLKPLADIAPQQIHPVLRQSFQALWHQFSIDNPQQAKSIRPVPFAMPWSPSVRESV